MFDIGPKPGFRHSPRQIMEQIHTLYYAVALNSIITSVFLQYAISLFSRFVIEITYMRCSMENILPISPEKRRETAGLYIICLY